MGLVIGSLFSMCITPFYILHGSNINCSKYNLNSFIGFFYSFSFVLANVKFILGTKDLDCK